MSDTIKNKSSKPIEFDKHHNPSQLIIPTGHGDNKVWTAPKTHSVILGKGSTILPTHAGFPL